MGAPSTWPDWLPFPDSLENDWQPVPRSVLIIACALYGVFLLQLAHGSGLLLMIDLVLIPIHEGGHLFFQFFGEFLAVAGGTLMQLGVPFALAVYFFLQRQIQGTAFCLFVFFEQFLPIATYMADARAQELPLLSVGDSDVVIHDWNYLFGKVGCLRHDIQIAHSVRALGWIGMLSTVGWMVWRSLEAGAARPTAPTVSRATAA